MLLPYSAVLAKKKIVLASASPRRKYALQELGLQFTITPSTFAEDLDKYLFDTPAGYVSETARLKVLEVYKRLEESKEVPDLIIGADSIVVLNNKILEKPADVTHAKSMLSELSGSRHSVITAVVLCIAQADAEPKIVQFYEETFVQFSQLSESMIEAYVATGTPMDKAGGYGIQEVIGGSFVERIEGDYYNVTGFPLNRFCKELITAMDL